MSKIVLTTVEELLELVRRIFREERGEQTPPSNTYRKYLPIAEAANYLGLPKATLYQYTSQRLIPFTKSGRRLMFSIAELDVWLASRRKSTRQEIESEVFTKKQGKK